MTTLTNLLDLLDAYLPLKSTDGNLVRQSFRRQLADMSRSLRANPAYTGMSKAYKTGFRDGEITALHSVREKIRQAYGS